MIHIIFTFLFGGFMVILVSLISESVSNTIAALLWAFPFTIIPTLYYFHLQNKSSKHILDFLWKIIFSVLFLSLNILILYYIYKITNKLIFSIIFTCFIYIFLSLIYIHSKERVF
jgi:hypothetical protein